MGDFTEERPTSHPVSPHDSRRKYLLLAVPLVLLLAVIFSALFFPSLTSLFPGEETVSLTVHDGARVRAIQVEVLNAAGESGLARTVTNYLRDKGVDVVDIGTYREREFDNSIVIDRANNYRAAEAVAKVLGLPPERIVSKADSRLYLDVTVVIGKDYTMLTPLQPQSQE